MSSHSTQHHRSPSSQPKLTFPCELEPGMKLLCKSKIAGDYVLAHILETRIIDGIKRYYVHFDGYNRRADELVTYDRFKEGSPVTFEATKKSKKVDPEPTPPDSNSPPSPSPAPSIATVASGAAFEARPRNIHAIRIGRWEIDTWYYSPYPKEIVGETGYTDMLYICEFCLAPFKLQRSLDRHMRKCKMRCPPGDEIYRDSRVAERKKPISVFEVDGAKQKEYCQNIGWLSKLFLDHKLLWSDIDIFDFYVVTEVDELGCHFIGYFSKYKPEYCPKGNNLSCIMVLPPFQKDGYGRFLISFSFELSKKEGLVGHPEEPLSDLGLLSYFSYWKYTIIEVLQNSPSSLSCSDISSRTSIPLADIKATVSRFSLIKPKKTKGDFIFFLSPKVLEEHKAKPPKVPVHGQLLHWTPRPVESTQTHE